MNPEYYIYPELFKSIYKKKNRKFTLFFPCEELNETFPIQLGLEYQPTDVSPMVRTEEGTRQRQSPY